MTGHKPFLFLVGLAFAMPRSLAGNDQGAESVSKPAGNPVLTGGLETVEITVKVRTGGELAGVVLDHSDHGLVLLSNDVPYVFAWDELDPASGLNAKRILLERVRGGREKFTAGDYFGFGEYALDGGRNDLAANEFERAKTLDRTFDAKIKSAFETFRKRNDDWSKQQKEMGAPAEPMAAAPERSTPGVASFDALPPPTEQVRGGVREAYLKFGEKVREVLGRDIVLVESEHFLIWTDWGPRERSRLTNWAEAMYSSLCERFGLDVERDIFLAKCPVFCFRSKARFSRFAREFDGYDARGAIGYTRSIEKNGHVHMAFARMGSTPADYNRFACTLVHEGTHAFLHRIFGSMLLPHWVNEGYAELSAERVLGERCPALENADLLARSYARFDWPVADFLSRLSSIEVHQYPLAHSVISYLEVRSPQGLVRFIRDLKRGSELSTALAGNFDGLTVLELDRAWKDWIRESMSPPLADHPP